MFTIKQSYIILKDATQEIRTILVTPTDIIVKLHLSHKTETLMYTNYINVMSPLVLLIIGL